MCLDSMIFLDGGITCKNRRGTPILAKFAETSFRQITNLAFCCGRKQGLREMLAATFLGPACLPQRHFSSLLDRKKRFFRGCFGFVSEGAFISRVDKKAAVSPRLLCVFHWWEWVANEWNDAEGVGFLKTWCRMVSFVLLEIRMGVGEGLNSSICMLLKLLEKSHEFRQLKDHHLLKVSLTENSTSEAKTRRTFTWPSISFVRHSFVFLKHFYSSYLWMSRVGEPRANSHLDVLFFDVLPPGHHPQHAHGCCSRKHVEQLCILAVGLW